MKAFGIFPVPFVLLLIVFFISPLHIMAQEKSPIPSETLQSDTLMLTPPCLHLDMPRISMGEFGKGLQYYKVMVLKKPGMVKTHISQTGFRSEMGKKAISDSEIDNLRQNMLFIDNKCQSMMKKWVRDERWDLNLEEVIRGFYMKPVF